MPALTNDDLVTLIERIEQGDLDELADCLTGPTESAYLHARRQIVINSLNQLVVALEASK